MGTAFEVFLQVWLVGYTILLATIVVTTWVLYKADRPHDSWSVIAGRPDVFVKLLLWWFLVWPYLLARGVVVWFRPPKP